MPTKCSFCNKLVDRENEAHVVVPNMERVGYKRNNPTKFIHASCFETRVILNNDIRKRDEEKRTKEFAEVLAKIETRERGEKDMARYAKQAIESIRVCGSADAKEFPGVAVSESYKAQTNAQNAAAHAFILHPEMRDYEPIDPRDHYAMSVVAGD